MAGFFLYKRKRFAHEKNVLNVFLIKIGKRVCLIPRQSESQIWLYYCERKGWFL
jgi:hypothetical protein